MRSTSGMGCIISGESIKARFQNNPKQTEHPCSKAEGKSERRKVKIGRRKGDYTNVLAAAFCVFPDR